MDASHRQDQSNDVASIRASVIAADEGLTNAIRDARALDEIPYPEVQAQAIRDAELADAVAGKGKEIAGLLRDAATPPVGGAT